MLILRPIKKNDLDQLYELASLSEVGLTTLPYDREVLERRVKESCKSFQSTADRPGRESYLFVAQDLSTKRVVGTSAVFSKVGGYEPSYTYELKTEKIKSKLLNVKKNIQYLQLKIDHNGPSEVGTLFLSPRYQKSGNGRLLSLSRFLFMKQFASCFEDEVIVELRGVIDEQGCSPFWEALGKHFFEVDFKKADLMVMRDKRFIDELMPKHPIYIPLLPATAQAVIGKVHSHTEPALHMLLQEGFQLMDEIDIFEAGPLLKAKVARIRVVKQSRTKKIKDIVTGPIKSKMFLLSSVGRFQEFCSCTGNLKELKDGVVLTTEVAAAMGVSINDKICFVELK